MKCENHNFELVSLVDEGGTINCLRCRICGTAKVSPKHQFSIEKIEIKDVPQNNVSVRIALVGFMSKPEAQRIIEHWREKRPLVIEELFTTMGLVVTLDFGGKPI